MPGIEDRLEALEQQLRDLAAREAIRELAAEYCRQVVRGNSEGLVELFTADGSIRTHLPQTGAPQDVAPRGREQLREVYADLDARALQPCIHNHIVELDGDQARGFCSVEIRLTEDGVAHTAAGHYEDEYRRVDGSWRFQHRELHVYHWVPHSQGWA